MAAGQGPWGRRFEHLLLRQQGVAALYSEHRSGDGVRVAVIDTGLNYSRHPNEFSKELILAHESVVGGPGDDLCGHGTAVSSLICGVNLGLAPRVLLHSYRVSSSSRGGIGEPAVREAIRRALAADVDLINISVGATTGSDKLAGICQQAADQGVVIIAAAGNDSAGGGQELRFPATYPSVISVGAVGADGRRSLFSNYAEELDLVDYGEGLLCAGKSSQLRIASGTSYAAAQVTGLLSLAKAASKLVGREWSTAELLTDLPKLCRQTLRQRSGELGWGQLHVAKLIRWSQGT